MSGSTLSRLADAGVIAVVRADQPERAVQAAHALLAGGVTAIELTFTTPGAAEALAEARRALGNRVLLGAGTILRPDEVRQAVDAGADYLVAPNLSGDVLRAMLASGRLAVPGVFTPSEVAMALEAGAEVVKLFPAGTGGIAHFKALRGPFPDLRVIPTGGINLSNLEEWLRAGVVAVGAGSELCASSLIGAEDWPAITERARAYAAAARQAIGEAS